MSSGSCGGNSAGVPVVDPTHRECGLRNSCHRSSPARRPRQSPQKVADATVCLRIAKQGGELGQGTVQSLSVANMPKRIVKREELRVSPRQAPVRWGEFPAAVP